MNRVREVRLKKGWTQEDLAKRIGTDQSEVSKVENDKLPSMTLDLAQRFAKALGKTVDYLWPG